MVTFDDKSFSDDLYPIDVTVSFHCILISLTQFLPSYNQFLPISLMIKLKFVLKHTVLFATCSHIFILIHIFYTYLEL